MLVFLKMLLIRFLMLRYVVAALASLGIVLPVAAILKTIGIPLLIILGVLLLPVLLVLLAVGLPIFAVIVGGAVLIFFVGLFLTFGVVVLKIGLFVVLPIVLIVWLVRLMRGRERVVA